jgi:hypothetical protein
MRFSTLSIGLLAVLTPLAAAWSKEGKSLFGNAAQRIQTLLAAPN